MIMQAVDLQKPRKFSNNVSTCRVLNVAITQLFCLLRSIPSWLLSDYLVKVIRFPSDYRLSNRAIILIISEILPIELRLW